jgi:methyltransferase family protein
MDEHGELGVAALASADVTAPNAQTLAGYAILLEVGASLGLIDPLLKGTVSPPQLSQRTGLSAPFVSAFYEALAHSGLATIVGGSKREYAAGPDLGDAINAVGYLAWGLRACAPLIANSSEFAADPVRAVDAHPRDGEQVARTSRWIGERDFYPQAERAIVSRRPRHIVDLGSGSCGLLIRCLKRLPEATGVGLDLSADACRHARVRLEQAGLGERVRVINAPIQSLVDDAEPLRDAELIHASFVLHDLLPDDESTLDEVLRTCRRVASRAAIVVIEGVPFASDAAERSFSAAYTFLHTHFMRRRLLSAEEWTSKLSRAGYAGVTCAPLPISSGRVIIATV